MTRTLVMVGMMGAGKTAVGGALARRLAVPFLDSDAEIERAAAATIPEIFARDGEGFFRAREREVIARLLAGPPVVLSVGGGAWLSEENRALISEKAAAVWLKVPLDVLWERVRHRNTRPLLRTANPRATLEQLYAERLPAYERAQVIVEGAAGLSIDEMCDRLVVTLDEEGLIRY